MDVFSYDDYRDIIQQAFKDHTRTSCQSSMSSFARKISLSPSRLSDVLVGRNGLSSESALKVGQRLGLNARDCEYFVNLVALEHSRSRRGRLIASEKIEAMRKEDPYKVYGPDSFHLLAKWYYMAILEIVDYSKEKIDFKALAKSLGICEIEVRGGLSRLMGAGLIRSSGELLEKSSRRFFKVKTSSDQIKRFHRSLLEKAKSALFSQQTTEREFITTFLPIQKSRLPELKIRLEEIRREFVASTNDHDKDSLYCLSIQFYNLTGGNDHC